MDYSAYKEHNKMDFSTGVARDMKDMPLAHEFIA